MGLEAWRCLVPRPAWELLLQVCDLCMLLRSADPESVVSRGYATRTREAPWRALTHGSVLIE